MDSGMRRDTVHAGDRFEQDEVAVFLQQWAEVRNRERADRVKLFFEDGSVLVKESGEEKVPRWQEYRALVIIENGKITKNKASGHPQERVIREAMSREAVRDGEVLDLYKMWNLS